MTDMWIQMEKRLPSNSTVPRCLDSQWSCSPGAPSLLVICYYDLASGEEIYRKVV
jgi:hypothetical protein